MDVAAGYRIRAFLWGILSAMKKGLAENLAALMARERVTQAQLSKATRIPATSLYRLMSGVTTNPTLDTLQTLSKYFGVQISELVGDMPIPGLDKGYRGDFSLPFPKSGEAAKLMRLISQADQDGSLTPEIADSVHRLLALLTQQQ